MKERRREDGPRATQFPRPLRDEERWLAERETHAIDNDLSIAATKKERSSSPAGEAAGGSAA